jgi:hypothetical protein
VKPPVGFTLPSAGVTPAPSIKKDAGLHPCSNFLSGKPQGIHLARYFTGEEAGRRSRR